MSNDLLEDGPPDAAWTVILAHGAGAGMDTPWMTAVATQLAAHDIHVVRFEFPYMAARRRDGKRRPPDRAPVLLDAWRAVAARFDPSRLVIGGKSMGGRMASMVADELRVAGLVCLGYPFHPPGRPEKLRTEHLAALRTRALIAQGERDPFGTRDEVAGYALSPAIRLQWLPGGNHDFTPPRGSGRTQKQNVAEAVDAVAAFVVGLDPAT
ncbi:MAG: alpha/beta family hydrolase [Rhodospirillales bacterium]